VPSTSNSFLRQVNAEGADLVLEATSRNVVVNILTPMDENVRTIASQLENQSKYLRIREIEPSSHIQSLH
jgi:hypothetical protein